MHNADVSDWKSALYTALVNSPAAVLVLDASGAITFANTAFEKLSGYPAPSLKTLDSHRVYRVLSQESSLLGLPRPASNPSPWYSQVEIVHADGQPLLTSFLISPIVGDGEVEGYVFIQQSADESKELKTELNSQREALELYGRLIESYSDQLRQAMNQLDRTLLFAVHALTSALDARDPYTAGHSFRVSHNASLITSGLPNANQEMIETVHVGSLLHDIGKIGVPDEVLRKPEALTPEEYELVKRHPVIGYNILVGIPDFEDAIAIVRSHHERLDGSGYPDGLKGNEISPLVRCVSVCDIFDALTSPRPYRLGMNAEDAIEVLKEEAAKGWWDPAIVEMLARLSKSGELVMSPEIKVASQTKKAA